VNPSQPITPLPIPPDTRTILLYGGAFDPPHRAHVQLPHLVARAACPDAILLYIPAAQSPLKSSPAAADSHRLAMLRLATKSLPRAAIWTDELDRAAASPSPIPSYWIDTLRRAAQAAPHAQLHFLIGADQAADFHRWREYRDIVALATPLVVLRPPIDSSEKLRARLIESAAWTPVEIEQWLARIVPTPLLEDSATAIREKLAQGICEIPELDPAVHDYIRRHRLYGFSGRSGGG
jgi:nicotinate-nucleotide adenylyltransferase